MRAWRRRMSARPSTAMVASVAVSAGAAFVALSLRLTRPGLVWGERSAAEALASPGPPLSSVAILLDEGLNDWGAPVVFACLLVVVTWRWGRRAGLWLLAAGLSTTILKITDVVERPRPTTDLSWGTYLPGYGGYPSGHVVYVVMLAGTLGMLVCRYEPRGRIRGLVTATMLAAALFIGPARLMTNDHWAADVVGGYLLAIFLLSTGLVASRWLDGRRDDLQASTEALDDRLDRRGLADTERLEREQDLGITVTGRGDFGGEL